MARKVPAPKTLLLFAATTGYQVRVFAEAARRMGVDLTLATDRCHILEDPWGDRAVPIRFEDPAGSAEAFRGRPYDGVAAVGDRPALVAAEAAERTGARFHPVAAVRACHDKYVARQLYRAAGLPVPDFFRVPTGSDPHEAAGRATYPCVLKPLGLSASRGVIRANDHAEFVAAFERIRQLLASPEIATMREEQNAYIQVERYIPGREFAIEGLITGGELQVLAIFDKPDPLEGPYFEETIYVTPSRDHPAVQDAITATVARAARALGLTYGPVHAEVRWDHKDVWMLETAARPIGGLCAHALTFDGGTPLEEIIIRHALGEDVSGILLDGPATGVMMIPIPKAGVFESANGVERASTEVIITAKPGQKLVPLPEGASYLGFIFARGETPDHVEQTLRSAHSKLHFEIATALPTLK